MEHVVAKAFFNVQPDPSITVPACKACNHLDGDGKRGAIHHDEEYMRTVLCISEGAEENAGAVAMFKDRVLRSFENSPKLGASFYNTTRMVSSINPQGFLIEKPAFEMKWPRFYRVLRKITKGLFYKWSGYTLPASHDVFCLPLTTEGYLTLEPSFFKENSYWPIILGKERAFACVANRYSEPHNTGWLMLFYEFFPVAMFTFPRELINGDGSPDFDKLRIAYPAPGGINASS